MHRDFPLSLLEEGWLTEPETENGIKCFTTAVRHTVALGAWRNKIDFLPLALTACDLRSTSLMEEAKP